MSRNNIQHDAKNKNVNTIIIALLFPNLTLVLYQMFSYDFPKIRNIPKIFLRSFENMMSSSVYFLFDGILSVCVLA